MVNNMTTRYNPSISEEPRYQVTQPIDRKAQESILDWLDRIGRLLPHVIDNSQTEAISRKDEGK
ncbi:Protein of unknown function (DUF3134) [Leptolyngbya sp. PCC 7375]|nr:Protein of unknown function (DUF3134) [Leptolyngbya sp. PCC 7375]